MAGKVRKRKFVVWLNNHTDRRDDEWVVRWAVSAQRARAEVLSERMFDATRFSPGRVLTAAEFFRENGFGA